MRSNEDLQGVLIFLYSPETTFPEGKVNPVGLLSVLACVPGVVTLQVARFGPGLWAVSSLSLLPSRLSLGVAVT